MDANARLTGYLTILFLVVLAAAIGGLFHRAAYAPHRYVHLHLSETGSLMRDDPVTEFGVVVGQVEDIAMDQDGRTALVTLELYHRNFLAADTRFVDFNQSLLGTRAVVLVPGHSSRPLDETRVQEGLFAPSAVEALRRADDLVIWVERLEVDWERLFVRDQAPLSPQRLNRELTGSLLRMQRLTQAIDPLERRVVQSTAAMERFGDQANRGLRASQSGLDRVWNRTGQGLVVVDSAENKIAWNLTRAEMVMHQLQDSTGLAGALLRDRTLYDELESVLGFLHAAVQGMQQSGLNKKIQFQRNIHFGHR